MVKAIPEGYHSVTPSLTFTNTQLALDFYKNAFNGKVLDLMKSPDGRGIVHATIQIEDSILMLGDEMPMSPSAESLGGSPISLYIYTQDADKLFNQAVAAGCKVTLPISDMFWGDRAGNVQDPFGYRWMIATHKQDLTEEQLKKGAADFFAQMGNN